MTNPLRPGMQVKLLGIPDWLLKDLPKSEQVEIISFIGGLAIIQEIDKYGYVWIGFGSLADVGDAMNYSGHSFAVPPEFVEIKNQ